MNRYSWWLVVFVATALACPDPGANTRSPQVPDLVTVNLHEHKLGFEGSPTDDGFTQGDYLYTLSVETLGDTPISGPIGSLSQICAAAMRQEVARWAQTPQVKPSVTAPTETGEVLRYKIKLTSFDPPLWVSVSLVNGNSEVRLKSQLIGSGSLVYEDATKEKLRELGYIEFWERLREKIRACHGI